METTYNNQMKVSDWLIIYLITSIPFVNIVMLLIWAFGQSDNSTRSNWAKANLILLAVIIGLYLFFLLIFGMSYFFNS